MNVRCPHCQSELNIAEFMVGTEILCPKCHAFFDVRKDFNKQNLVNVIVAPLIFESDPVRAVLVTDESVRRSKARSESFRDDDENEAETKYFQDTKDKVLPRLLTLGRWIRLTISVSFVIVFLNMLFAIFAGIARSAIFLDMVGYLAVVVILAVLIFDGVWRTLPNSRGTIITTVLLQLMIMMILGHNALLMLYVLLFHTNLILGGIEYMIIAPVLSFVAVFLSLSMVILLTRGLYQEDVYEYYQMLDKRRRRLW